MLSLSTYVWNACTYASKHCILLTKHCWSVVILHLIIIVLSESFCLLCSVGPLSIILSKTTDNVCSNPVWCFALDFRSLWVSSFSLLGAWTLTRLVIVELLIFLTMSSWLSSSSSLPSMWLSQYLEWKTPATWCSWCLSRQHHHRTVLFDWFDLM